MNLDLYIFKLSRGSHNGGPETGVCAMEAVAWMAGENHYDTPQCACLVLGKFIQRINDIMDDEDRKQLNPLILKLIGTRSEEHEKIRCEYLVREVTRRVVPIWFERAKLDKEALELRVLSPGVSMLDLRGQVLKSMDAASSVSAFDAASFDAAAASAAASAAAYAAAYADSFDAPSAAYAAADAASAFDAASSVTYRKNIWPETLKILNEAIELGPYNTDEFYDITRMNAYRDLVQG